MQARGLLAVVLASFHKNWNHALANIGGGLAYVAVTLLLVRPFLVRSKKWLVKDFLPPLSSLRLSQR